MTVIKRLFSLPFFLLSFAYGGDDSCKRLFEPSQAKESSRNIRFIDNRKSGEKLLNYFRSFAGDYQASFLKAVERDKRIALLKLSQFSSSLDRVDHFSAPALSKVFVFSKNTDKETFKYLEQISKRYIFDIGDVNKRTPDVIVPFLNLLSIKYRLALEIVNMAHYQKTGKHLKVSSSEFSLALWDFILESKSEMSEHSKAKRFFSKLEITEENKEIFSSKIKKHLDQYPLFDISNAQFGMSESLVSQVNPDLNFQDMLQEMSHFLDSKLSETPVGISLPVQGKTSSLRFNDMHYYGSWNAFVDVHRKAYLRTAKNDLLMEVELKLSAYQKKLLAVLLDKTHRGLDPIAHKQAYCGKGFYTCGSYAPFTLLKTGRLTISPAYYSPFFYMLSLYAQKHLLGVSYIKGTQTTVDWTQINMKETFGSFVMHDVIALAIEWGIYTGVFSLLTLLL